MANKDDGWARMVLAHLGMLGFTPNYVGAWEYGKGFYVFPAKAQLSLRNWWPQGVVPPNTAGMQASIAVKNVIAVWFGVKQPVLVFPPEMDYDAELFNAAGLAPYSGKITANKQYKHVQSVRAYSCSGAGPIAAAEAAALAAKGGP
jgi:hypothetical protein